MLKENSLLEELLCFLVTGRSHTGKVVQFSTAFIMKVEAFFKDKFGEVLTGLFFFYCINFFSTCVLHFNETIV